MKLFNVNVAVRITEIGELQDPQPSFAEELAKDFRDDPLKAQAKLMEKAASLMAPPKVVGFFPGDAPAGVSMNSNVQIAAGSFEELQAILQKFHEVGASLTIESQTR